MNNAEVCLYFVVFDKSDNILKKALTYNFGSKSNIPCVEIDKKNIMIKQWTSQHDISK